MNCIGCEQSNSLNNLNAYEKGRGIQKTLTLKTRMIIDRIVFFKQV